MSKSPQKIELTLSRSTKGTHVYGAVDPSAAIISVYVQKEALPASPPATVTLTLEFTV